MKKILLLAAVALLAILALLLVQPGERDHADTPVASAGLPVVIEHARIRLTPAGAPMAGYFELHNHSGQELRILGATSPDFAEIMLHRTVTEDGRSRMEHQHDGVQVPAGGVVRFEPGGLHLMLMNAKRPLAVGDQVELRLDLAGGAVPSPLVLPFVVVSLTHS